jgi:hypothetical protein
VGIAAGNGGPRLQWWVFRNPGVQDSATPRGTGLMGQDSAEAHPCPVSYYASGLDGLIHETKPAAWVHGHIQTVGDNMVGSTLVICNPLGITGTMIRY